MNKTLYLFKYHDNEYLLKPRDSYSYKLKKNSTGEISAAGHGKAYANYFPFKVLAIKTPGVQPSSIGVHLCYNNKGLYLIKIYKSFFNKFEETSLDQLPLYIGWHLTSEFTKYFKRKALK